MKPKFTIEELALALYNSTSHSDIRPDWSGYDYTISVNPDGTIGKGDDSEEFTASFDFSDALWEGIDRDTVFGSWSPERDDAIDQLLSRADDQEDLSNPDYASMVSSLYDDIANWLDDIAPTRIWYAAMVDSDDQDWGTGSYDLGEAKTTVSRWRESGYPAAYIAIIDESGSEPMCIDEIHDF